ncbi:IS3 family transposase [Cryobacterium sp. TMT1-3]|uniref:IS3 family transposase n=2 Tax=Microbacteriaceae TaxID=85023 RepID=A0A5F0D0N9_9MICO|nr:IS3 family transposase [Cryobacterium luteum]TFC31028.1 IS3 family transposase [Cryobacterium sp. TMT1-3]
MPRSMPAFARGPRRMTPPGCSSWSERTVSCGGRMPFCAVRRLSSRRSSTAPPTDDHVHRPEQARLRGRADLQGTVDRPVDVLRGHQPAAVTTIEMDEVTVVKIRDVHQTNYGVYGVRKVHAQLKRDDHPVARCTVERLLRREGLRGITRSRTPRTTIPGPLSDRPDDLVRRAFTAPAPNCLWVADITYIRTFSGWVYAAFVTDEFSRRVVGWQLSSIPTRLALDVLEMGIWTRESEGRDLSQLVHHSDRGVQYRAVRYTERLAQAEAVASVGSTGDSYGWVNARLNSSCSIGVA